MARLTPEQAATFPTNTGGTSFLSLQNDKDSAIVRFAYNTVNDILTDSTHDAKNSEGKFRQIDCLRHSKDEPESVCPLCASGSPIKKSVFLNVRNEATGEMQIWQRSEAFFLKQLKPIFDEVTQGGRYPLCSVPIKIIRNGAKGDNKTTYLLLPQQGDNMTLDQFPEEIVPQEKGMIKVFTFNQLQNYVNTGIYPEENQNQSQPAITPRGNDYNNFGQPARVEDYQNQGYNNQAPINNNRRTMPNNGGY
ncbi:MAG: hypothetical protein ACI3T9_01095 [Romboutsia timonensis]